MTWYKTGTVSVAPGNNAVIGSGTAFIRNARVGDAFRGPDGEWYEVTNIASDTVLSIAPAYQGAAVAAGVYSLAPMQGYVKDSADALRAATQVIASGVADMQEQVAIATEAAESAEQSKAVAGEQAGIASSAAQASTENKNAAQLAAQQGGASAQASGEAAVRAETARDSIIKSEQAAAASAAAAEDSADRAEEVTLGKAASGDNNDITSLRAITPDGFDRLRQGIAPMVGATASTAGKKGLVPAPAAGDQDKFLTAGGAYKEPSGGGLAVGTITAWKFSRATIPGGQIAHDGQRVTNGRALYPEFWALIQPFCVTDAVWLAAPYDKRGMYSSGDGSTDFRMPDDNAKHPDGNTFAAMVLRGDGKNSAGTPGLHQTDQLGPMLYANATSTGATPIYVSNASTATSGAVMGRVDPVTQTTPVAAAPNGTKWVTNTGSETRGSSSTVIWCTVVAKTAVNAGTVDVPALATAVSNQGSQMQAVDTRSTSLEFAYTSADTSFTNGAVTTLNHGLSGEPRKVNVEIIVVTTQHGYPVGTVIDLGSGGVAYIASGAYNFTLSKAATQISLTIASGGIVVVSAGAAQAFTSANIRLRVRASLK